MITVNNLSKAYNGDPVVHIPVLDIKEGELIGLVGNNGAGKTTFFRLLLDLIRADKGEVLSGGKNVATSEDWKKYTGAYLDEGFLYQLSYAGGIFLFCRQAEQPVEGGCGRIPSIV